MTDGVCLGKVLLTEDFFNEEFEERGDKVIKDADMEKCFKVIGLIWNFKVLIKIWLMLDLFSFNVNEIFILCKCLFLLSKQILDNIP